MDRMNSTVRLDREMTFEATAGGHRFVIDASAEHGGHDRGPNPKSLLLVSLAGCTGMDVAIQLRKMRQPFERLEVDASAAKATQTHPHTLVDMVVTYDVTGNVDPQKLWRAVTRSHHTYCGVSAMLAKHTPIRSRVLLNGVELAAP